MIFFMGGGWEILKIKLSVKIKNILLIIVYNN